MLTVQTPCYVIDKEKFLGNLASIKENFIKEWGNNILVGYSVKTNSLDSLIRIAKDEDMYAEVVSDDEYDFVVGQGFCQKKIIFNGPQKGERCLIQALLGGSIVNIDNLEEIDKVIYWIREHKDRSLEVGLRLNFDLERICNGETTAGKEGSRFGLCIENGEFGRAVKKLSEYNIKIVGLHLHYSTKTRSLKFFKALAEKACEISRDYGLIEHMKFIDMGGGFWGGRILDGKPSMFEYSKIISDILKTNFDPKKVTLIIEPGASLLATAIDYYSRVLHVKMVRNQKIVTIDGSLLDVNPFMSVREQSCDIYPSGNQRVKKQIICGSTCIENDRFIQVENQLEMKKGDTIIVHYAGAYTMVFNNCFINYPPYVYLKDNDDLKLLRKKGKIYN